MAETASRDFDAALANAPSDRADSFSKLAFGLTVYMWLVALWGAVVRITMSGDGCGQHWPTCHGEVVHVPKTIETWIELSHRLTTGLALPATIVLLIGSHRYFPAGSRVRTAAWASLAFTIVEALIGARLVLGRLVGADASISRAVIMPIHLVTTSVLLGALALTAWWSRKATAPRLVPATEPAPSRRHVQILLWAGLLGILAVSASGAVTALGDTVFPARAADLGGRVVEDHGEGAHFLQRLRVVHPLVAVAVAGLLLHVAAAVGGKSRWSSVQRLRSWVIGLVWLQIGIGIVNVFLSAPGYLQLIHLAVATALWLSFVWFGAAAWEEAKLRS